MLKVLFVIWSLERGGAERFLVALLKHIDQTKIKPVVCCLNWKGKWSEEVEAAGIEIIALNKKSGLDLGAFIKLFKLIKTGNFQIVNTHLWTADVMGRVAAFMAKTPVVISTAQNVDVWKTWWHRLIDKILSFKTDRLIAVSEAVKKYYHQKVGIPSEKIIYIPNAVEVEKYSRTVDVKYLYNEFDLKEQDFILACIGRLTHQKGQAYLLEALHFLRVKYPNLRVLFVGDGEDREKLESMVKQLEIMDLVRFVGYRNDINQILKFSHSLILPSLFEGLPLCVLEAMAAAKPIIATNIGGVDELLVDNESGIIVEPQDPGALTKAIEKLMLLPDQGQQMGLRAQKVVIDKFSIELAARETVELFLNLTKKKT